MIRLFELNKGDCFEVPQATEIPAPAESSLAGVLRVVGRDGAYIKVVFHEDEDRTKKFASKHFDEGSEFFVLQGGLEVDRHKPAPKSDGI